MKRFYLLALSCLALWAAQAQNAVPRPRATGANFSVNCQAGPGREMPALPRRARKSQWLTPAQVARHRAPQPASPLRAVADSTFCTAHSRYVDGTLMQMDTLVYDKYGLRSLVSTYDANAWDRKNKQERYTYEVGLGNYWTRRVIETDYRPWGNAIEPVDGWYRNNEVSRELDAQGRVLRIQITDPRSGLERTMEYDYAHEYYDWDGTPHLGFLVGLEEKQNGVVNKQERYAWHEAAGQYLPTFYRSSMYGSYEESEHFADSVVTTTFAPNDSSGMFKPSGQRVDYYRLGGHPCEGSKTIYADGEISGWVELTIEAGDSVTRLEQHYVAATDAWVPERKVVTLGTHLQTPLYYEKIYNYDAWEGAWTLASGNVWERISESPTVDLYRRTAISGTYTNTLYYAKFAGADYEESVEMIDDETFATVSEQEGSTTYFLYSPDGGFKAGYEVLEHINTPIGSQTPEAKNYTVMVLVNDTTWQQASSFVYTSANGNIVRHTFNAEGYPDSIITCAPADTLPDTLTIRRFTYTDRGYSVETYDRGSLTRCEDFELMDDGWVSDITRLFTADSVVYRTLRTDRKQGGERTYVYDYDTQELKLDQVKAFTVKLYDTYELKHYINHEVVDSTDVVPTTQTYNYNWSDGLSWAKQVSLMHWDRSAGEWVGDSATYDEHYVTDFVPDYGRSDFIENYDDGNDGYGEVIASARLPLEYTCHWYCPWVPEQKAFVITSKYGSEIDVDTESGRTTVYYYNGDWVGADLYLFNADGLTEGVYHYVINGEEQNIDRYTLYTYTPEGFLTLRQESDSASGNVDTYTYERRTITVTGIDALQPDATAELTIDGLTLSAPGQPLSLYDLQGARVAAGTGSVTAPRPGLYIIKVGQASAKVMLR